MRTKFFALFAAIAAVFGIGLLAPSSASASTQFVGDTSCPSYVTGGGGCHYVQLDRSVLGATGTMRVIVFYHFSASGSSYEIYDARLQNNTSRAHSVSDLLVQNPSLEAPEEQRFTNKPIANGGAVWDQHNVVGSAFQGRFLPTGVGPRVNFELHNSAEPIFFITSDKLP